MAIAWRVQRRDSSSCGRTGHEHAAGMLCYMAHVCPGCRDARVYKTPLDSACTYDPYSLLSNAVQARRRGKRNYSTGLRGVAPLEYSTTPGATLPEGVTRLGVLLEIFCSGCSITQTA